VISSIHLIGSHELGGADRFFIRLTEALTRAGHPAIAVFGLKRGVIEVLLGSAALGWLLYGPLAG